MRYTADYYPIIPDDSFETIEMSTNNAYSDIYPKDYSRFKERCEEKLKIIQETQSELKSKIATQSSEYTEIIQKMEKEYASLKILFQDIGTLFGHFTSSAVELKA